MEKEIFRLDLEKEFFFRLKDIVKECGDKQLQEEILKAKKITISSNKIKGAAKAREIRAKVIDEKIINAINLLYLEGENITIYKVAKYAQISYNSAKKRKEFILELSKKYNNIY